MTLTDAVFGEPTGVIVGVDVDTFAPVRIVVVPATVIALEFLVSVSNSVDEMSDVRAGVMIDIIPNIGVDVLTDANVNALAVSIAASKFAASTS